MNNLLTKSLCFFSIVAAIFTSCQKKDNDDDQQNKKIYLIKTVIDGDNVTQYSYDDKGRITKEENLQERTVTYVYTDSSVIKKEYSLGGNLKTTDEYKLGTNGLAKSCVSYDRTNYFTYNNAGQLTRSYADVYDANGTFVLNIDTKNYYTNNNLDSVVTTTSDGLQSSSYVVEYDDEYYTDKPNTVDNANNGMPWLGVGSRNLVKRVREWFSPSSPMESYTVTYEYDNMGRVVKGTTNDLQGNSDSTILTYY
jgi:YD repeat-containing protein